jgi:uncharacterized membrane protein YfcA
MMLPLLVGGGIGAVVGQRIAPRLNDRRLRQGFSLLLIGSALLSGVEAWRRHTPEPATGSQTLTSPQQPLTPPQP